MKTVIHDTADVIITNKATGEVVVNAEAQTVGFSQSVEETPLNGGIGNKKLYVIKSNKEIELNMTSAFFDIGYLAAQQGVGVEADGTAVVTKHKKVTVASGKVEVPTGAEGDVTIISDKGQEKVTPTGESATVSPSIAADGESVTLVYKEEVTGNKVEINADNFGANYEVTYKTISYNPKTAEVYADVYYVFPNASISGTADVSLTNGEAYAPEVNFTVLSEDGESKLGEMIEVPRA